MIDHHTFAVNILENAFDMKSQMTRNMIQMIVNRYDDKQSNGFDYNIFVSDLEALDRVTPSVRIFKTQTEINYFHQSLKEDLAEDGSLGASRKHRIVCEP